MVRFLHTSDWQLGMRRHFLDADANARFEQARIDAIRRIGEASREHGCAFVVVAGDVFENNHLQPRTIARTVDALRDVPVPVYLLPGNHDPLDPSSIFTRAEFVDACPPKVQVLTGDVVSHSPGVEIVSAPWRSKGPGRDLAAEACTQLSPAPAGTVRILVAHGAVTSFAIGRSDPAIIDEAGLEAALADGRIHYVALGDRHSATPIGPTGRIWYSGAPEPTDFDETNPGKALVVDLEAGAASVDEVEIGQWRFLHHHADLNSIEDVHTLRATLDQIPARERCILKLSFRGSLSIEAKAALDAVLDDLRHPFAAIDTWERHTDLVVLPDDDDLESIPVGGYARDALQHLLGQAQSGGPDAQTARDAIALLHRLARGRT